MVITFVSLAETKNINKYMYNKCLHDSIIEILLMHVHAWLVDTKLAIDSTLFDLLFVYIKIL